MSCHNKILCGSEDFPSQIGRAINLAYELASLKEILWTPLMASFDLCWSELRKFSIRQRIYQHMRTLGSCVGAFFGNNNYSYKPAEKGTEDSCLAQLVAEGSLQTAAAAKAIREEILTMKQRADSMNADLQSLRTREAERAAQERQLRQNLQEDARQALGQSLPQSTS